MSTVENVNLGWLKDGNGKKFAPKTLSAQAIYDNSISGLNSFNVQGAIDELGSNINVLNSNLEDCFQSVSDGKALIASAITDKKVPTDATATFSTMAENISKIVSGGGGNALTQDVLYGKTFTNDDGIEYTGTMPNNGAVSPSALNAGGGYTIPAGYHNGSGKVTVNNLSSQTSATATADDIAEGKTAWVNGSKITGSLKKAPEGYSYAKRIIGYDKNRGFVGNSAGGWGETDVVITFPEPFATPPVHFYMWSGDETRKYYHNESIFCVSMAITEKDATVRIRAKIPWNSIGDFTWEAIGFYE